MAETNCCCSGITNNTPPPKTQKAKTTAKMLPSMILSILVAFFPKCPVCWAVYMSMFGSIGLAQLPYMGWLLPVLLTMLGIHLYLLYRKSSERGYAPLVISVAGVIIILITRTFFPYEKWLLIMGMVLVISGSLLNSFSGIRLQFASHKNQ